MRTIDADELKKCVLKWLPQDPCEKEEKEMPFETDICVSMLMEIDEQPTIQPEPDWIPTSERLPKINEDILLSYFDEVTVGWLNGDGSWSIYDGWKCVSADEVPAWIPLPKVYKPSGLEECLREERHE